MQCNSWQLPLGCYQYVDQGGCPTATWFWIALAGLGLWAVLK